MKGNRCNRKSYKELKSQFGDGLPKTETTKEKDITKRESIYT